MEDDTIRRDLPVASQDMAREAEREHEEAENREGTDPELIADLARLIHPAMRLDIRREALQAILGLSFPLDGSAERAFCSQNFVLGKAICRLCIETASDRLGCITGICNFGSVSREVINYVLHSQPEVVKIAYMEAFAQSECSEYAARLLANCTRISPGETHLRLLDADSRCLQMMIERTTQPSASGNPSNALGYCLVNMATVSRVRKAITQRREEDGGKSWLHRLYPALMQSENLERRRIVADVCRNCTFDDGLHADLLDESDDFLVALLSVIADSNDTLDQEETDKLPARMQYFEGRRATDDVLRMKVVDALYQCCATRAGREKLRTKGVYALAREFDRALAAEREARERGTVPKIFKAISSERSMPEVVEATLHSLIGILIRYESEMGIADDVHTLRDLQ